MTTNKYEQAIACLEIARAVGVVRVRDGVDTWLCTEEAWSSAKRQLSAVEDDDSDECGAEAYEALCLATPGPIASLQGSCGDWVPLVIAAIAIGLVREDEALAKAARRALAKAAR